MKTRVNSGFRRDVDEICALLGCYSTYSGHCKLYTPQHTFVCEHLHNGSQRKCSHNRHIAILHSTEKFQTFRKPPDIHNHDIKLRVAPTSDVRASAKMLLMIIGT